MKLIFRNFTSYEDLPKATLSENAVLFEEGETIEDITREASKYFLPLFGIVLLVLGLKWVFFESLGLNLSGFFYGSLLSLPFMVVHEFIHVLFLPKSEPIYVYQALKKGVLFVMTTEEMSKRRFIVMSLMPIFILGFLPLLAWLFFEANLVSSTLFFFALPMLLGGAGDLLNVSNTLKQVPKGAYIKLSGIHSYWFLKES